MSPPLRCAGTSTPQRPPVSSSLRRRPSARGREFLPPLFRCRLTRYTGREVHLPRLVGTPTPPPAPLPTRHRHQARGPRHRWNTHCLVLDSERCEKTQTLSASPLWRWRCGSVANSMTSDQDEHAGHCRRGNPARRRTKSEQTVYQPAGSQLLTEERCNISPCLTLQADKFTTYD